MMSTNDTVTASVSEAVPLVESGDCHREYS
jgi:hypothetical protein